MSRPTIDGRVIAVRAIEAASRKLPALWSSVPLISLRTDLPQVDSVILAPKPVPPPVLVHRPEVKKVWLPKLLLPPKLEWNKATKLLSWAPDKTYEAHYIELAEKYMVGSDWKDVGMEWKDFAWSGDNGVRLFNSKFAVQQVNEPPPLGTKLEFTTKETIGPAIVNMAAIKKLFIPRGDKNNGGKT